MERERGFLESICKACGAESGTVLGQGQEQKKQTDLSDWKTGDCKQLKLHAENEIG
jgi:hypothetical protein